MIDGQILGCEDAIQAFEGEGTFLIEEVGDMSLLEASLSGKAASGEEAAFDALQEFKPKEFVEVLEIHRNRGSVLLHSIQYGRILGEQVALCNNSLSIMVVFRELVPFNARTKLAIDSFVA